MKEVKFISLDPYLTVRYGETNPKQTVKFNHGCLVTDKPEEIEAVRNLIKRNVIFGLKEIKFEEKPEVKKPEVKKPEVKKPEVKKPEVKEPEVKEEIIDNEPKLKLKIK